MAGGRISPKFQRLLEERKLLKANMNRGMMRKRILVRIWKRFT